MTYLLIYNGKSGALKSKQLNLDYIIRGIKKFLKQDDQLKILDIRIINLDEELLEMKNTNKVIVIVLGGDGTISSVSSKLIDTSLVLSVLPGGTFNNFSKDLGIPTNIDDAIETIFNGKIIKIDTGEVNGISFINNSSIGLYPKSVLQRSRNQTKFGSGKIISMILAFIKTFYIFPLYKVHVKSDNIDINSKTSFIFVGNNQYSFEFPNLSRRSKLTDAKLALYLTKCINRFCLISFAVKNLFNRVINENDYLVVNVKYIEIVLKKKKVHVAIDGEVKRIRTPLHYKIKPASLNVIIPQQS
jgi:YegS/Rv2252/BmrU family lipid kinase